MKEVAVYEAKTRLSELLGEGEAAEQVTITRRGQPIARLVGVSLDRRALSAQRQAVDATIASPRQARRGARWRLARVDRRRPRLKAMAFVLDNSVVCGWFLENQASVYTDAIIERLRDERASVPAPWVLDFTNVLRSARPRQKMTAEAAQKVVAQIVSLPIDIDRHAVPASELLALSLRFGVSTYDAAYLGLALPLQLPLATAAGPLREAALACGGGVATEVAA